MPGAGRGAPLPRGARDLSPDTSGEAHGPDGDVEPPRSADAVERTFREASGRATATLIRLFGDIDIAEESVQDAFVVAVEKWLADGVPPSPAGWIITTARNKAVDRLRRESTRDDRHREAVALLAQLEPREVETMFDSGIHDDRLRLLFTCCHPALARPAQVALTLRLLGGLQTAQIAHGFLVSEATMAQRLVRAKAKIGDAHIPYRVPDAGELPERLPQVLATVYLILNEGYLATGGDTADRVELRVEAIRLARLLVELMPDEPEAVGLLALLLLTESRAQARWTPDGDFIRLDEQDRTMWDAALIAEGHALVRACLRRNAPGPYQVQAAIAAVHSDAATPSETDWRQIVMLYDQLSALDASPVVALNRAIAVAEVDGPAAALPLVDALEMRDYYLWHATRGDLLERTAEPERARDAFEQAASLTDNPAERAVLNERIAALLHSPLG